MKCRIGVVWMLLLCIMVCGCSVKTGNNGQLNLTGKVSIDCNYRQKHLLRTYTDSDKIDIILKYLHQIKVRHPAAADAENWTGDHCRITVYLPNGSIRNYDLLGKEILFKNSGQCYAADPDDANIMYHLVNHIESDI